MILDLVSLNPDVPMGGGLVSANETLRALGVGLGIWMDGVFIIGT